MRRRRARVDQRKGFYPRARTPCARRPVCGWVVRAACGCVARRRARVDQRVGEFREQCAGASREQRVGARASCARRPACGRVAREVCGCVARAARGCAGVVRASTSVRTGCTSIVWARRASSAWVRGVAQAARGRAESREQRVGAGVVRASTSVRTGCTSSVWARRASSACARSRASSAWLHGRRARVDQRVGGLREQRVGASREQHVGARAPCTRRPACGRVARAACGRVVRAARGAVSSECGGGCADGLAVWRRCADGQIATAVRTTAQTGR